MEKNKDDFKIYLTNNNKSGYKTKKNHILNNFPILYNEIIIHSKKNNLINLPFKEQLYLFLNNLTNIPVCLTCGKELKFKKSFNEGYGKFCSIKCTNTSDDHKSSVKTSNIKKFGGVSPSHSKDIQEKIKKTTKIRYGVDNIFKDVELIKKKTQEKYGVDHISQIESVKNKKKHTNILKYNVSTPLILKTSRELFKKSISNKFIEKYSHLNIIKIDYNNITIKCEKCNRVYIINRSVLYNRNNITNNPCTYCYPIKEGTSISEKNVREFLDSLGISYGTSNRTILKGQEIDIFIPSHNVAIEFDGLFWHSELFCDRNYHKNKTDICLENKIQLIHIFEDEWEYKQEIVKSRIMNILGLTPNKIFARKCKIKILTNKEYNSFMNVNHIQGSVVASIKIGLFYNNDLVAAMSFGGLRKSLGSKNKKDNYELLRYCNMLNTTVVGGAQKLLKWFIKNYHPKEIISYADRRWSKGNLYHKIGFNLVGITKPNYFYIIGNKRENRFKYRKNILVENGYDKNKTEHQIMLDKKIYRIYDSGSLIFKILL